MTGAPNLPGVLSEIEDVAGREAAIALALEFGGESLHVPRPSYLKDDHPLVRALGAEAARQVADHFTGEVLYVPRARRFVVFHLVDQGKSTREIARRLGIGTSTVSQYRRLRSGVHAHLNGDAPAV